MLQSIFLLVFLIGVGWLFYWSVAVERRSMGGQAGDRAGSRVRSRAERDQAGKPGGGGRRPGRRTPGRDLSPFAMRDPEDFHRRHGDRTPL
jgi:hypothetical protein